MSLELRKILAVIHSLKLSLSTVSDEGKHSPPNDKDTTDEHLLEMCEKILASSATMSMGKMNRWIGYIQGVMVQRNMTTVEAERTRYREIDKRLTEEFNLNTAGLSSPAFTLPV